MRKIILFVSLVLLSPRVFSQSPADTLTDQERVQHTMELQAEVDSLAQLLEKQRLENASLSYNRETKPDNQYIFPGLVVISVLLLLVLWMLYRNRRTMKLLVRSSPVAKGTVKAATAPGTIDALQGELLKLTKENENLGRVIAEYNGIRQDYESLKHGIMTTYKVRHYPGYDKEMDDFLAFQGVFDTETSVANYAYQKFLKPILAIADKNKNNPAKVTDEERQRVLDLLVSLSFLYIEYLYLRVGDLSVGGKMVERIKGFAKGNGLDPSLLKQMNTTSGNRALVLRMILDRSDLHKLTYPVFDETNLNN